MHKRQALPSRLGKKSILSVDSSAVKAIVPAAYVPVFDQTSNPKIPIMIIEARTMIVNLITFFIFIFIP